MITISEPKMPLPYGECKCFQSGTRSVRSLTDALIRLLYYLNMSAKRRHLHNKECREAARLPRRKARSVHADKLPVILRSTKQVTIDASVYSKPYNNSVHQKEPHVLAKPRENWTSDKEQWTFRVSATMSLFLVDTKTKPEEKSNVCSFTVSLLASKIPQTDYRILL